MPSDANALKASGKAILARPVFERLLFAQYWEDPQMDREALRVGPGKALFSVTSGGCTPLSLALQDPARVIAVDLNAAQSHLLELKIAGAKALEHDGYLELLGVTPSRRRQQLFAACRPKLSPNARRYWDAHLRAIEAGVLRAGRYERYLEAFRRLLILLQGRRRIESLFQPRALEERRRFYDEVWDTRAWRLFFRVFFSRTILGRAGLDPKFFTYVDGIGDFGEHFRRLARHVLVDLAPEENYFLAQICLGRYLNARALPPYLRAENFGHLRAVVDRIEIVTDEVAAALAALPDDSVDSFALSNVFEWVSPEAFERMLREIHRVARPGARLCYRNLLVRRAHLAALDGLFRPEDALAARLLFQDRSFVYSHFEVATALKPRRMERRGDATPAAVEGADTPLDAGGARLRHAGSAASAGR
jgi:S-adenosylmethionine-diacylglycerol 3-amino-3-carboxypropyl transferase